MPLRAAVVCGLLAPVTYTAALLYAGLVQPARFSNADDSISDLGADTASNPWIYNQAGTNLTGCFWSALRSGSGGPSRRTCSDAWVPDCS